MNRLFDGPGAIRPVPLQQNEDGVYVIGDDAVDAIATEASIEVSVHRTSGERRTFIRNGEIISDYAARSQIHDIFGTKSSMINPLTGISNTSYLNVGQPLVAVPGATSAPWFTDPGPLVYNAFDTPAVPASLPGMIDFDNGICKIKVPAGYGDGAGGRRRTQLNFTPLSARTLVRWELNFMVPNSDQAVYADGDPEAMLFWQIKSPNSEPCLAAVVRPNADGTVRLTFNHKWSALVGDTDTYRCQYNGNDTGVINAGAGRTIIDTTIQKNRWYKMVIEVYLDERKLEEPFYGQGRLRVTLNKKPLLDFSGPTLSIRGADGSPALTAVWTLGGYMYQPAALDLTSQNPAPRTREIWFKRARMYMLREDGMDALPVVQTPKGIYTLPDRSLSAISQKAISWKELKTLDPRLYAFRSVFVHDIGVHGSEWRSTGSEWRPIGQVVLAAFHGVPGNAMNPSKKDLDTIAGDLFQYIAPGGIMGLTGAISVEAGVVFAASSTAKEIAMTYGGQNFFFKSRTTTQMEQVIGKVLLRDPAYQLFPFTQSGGFGSGQVGSMTSSTVDSTQDVKIAVTGRFGAALGGTTPALTFTAAVAGAASATLSASWASATGTYAVTFSDGTVKNVTLTNGATTATWTGNVTATANATVAIPISEIKLAYARVILEY